MRRIVFTNDKGGVGKTTTVANQAVGISEQGNGMVRLDPGKCLKTSCFPPIHLALI